MLIHLLDGVIHDLDFMYIFCKRKQKLRSVYGVKISSMTPRKTLYMPMKTFNIKGYWYVDLQCLIGTYAEL